MDKNEIVSIIKEKYPQFPIELLDLIVEYIMCDLINDCKTIGIRRRY